MVFRPLLLVVRRRVATGALKSTTSILSPLEQKYYPHIGNREIVGYGRNGVPNYADDVHYPYPAIRFCNHSPSIVSLQAKEKGNWRDLTIDEVKTLYRHSFRQTLAEAAAPHGWWKLGLAYGFVFIGFGCIVHVYIRMFVTVAPKTVLDLPEYRDALKYKRVFSRGGPVSEAYNFDIEKNQFREN